MSNHNTAQPFLGTARPSAADRAASRSKSGLLFTTKAMKLTAMETLTSSVIIEVRKRTFKYRKHQWEALEGRKFKLAKLDKHLNAIYAHLNNPN